MGGDAPQPRAFCRICQGDDPREPAAGLFYLDSAKSAPVRVDRGFELPVPDSSAEPGAEHPPGPLPISAGFPGKDAAAYLLRPEDP